MKPVLAGILAAAAMMSPVAPDAKVGGARRVGIIIPHKDYKRRQKRAKMQKRSRKANRK